MSRQSLKDRLAAYFRRRHSTWIASGDLQRIVMQATSYTPQNVGRRLRELENEGVLEVEYRHGHAWYRLKDPTTSWMYKHGGAANDTQGNDQVRQRPAGVCAESSDCPV